MRRSTTGRGSLRAPARPTSDVEKCAGHVHVGALLLVLAAQLLGAGQVSALGPVAVPPTWGGDIGSRPRLTGNWGGVRDELGSKGVVFDVDVIATPQDVVSGGADTGAVIWGNAIYTLDVDTGKLGWWPGGFFNVKGDSAFGNSGYGDVGAVLPANIATLLPKPLDADTGLRSASFTQFLSPRFGLLAGKLDMMEFAHTTFHGDARTQFMNAALAIPMASALMPLSAFGGGALFLPTEHITLSALAIDPNGRVMDNDIGDAFDDGVMVIGGLAVTTRLFGLPGHHGVNGMWSDKTRLSLEQDPSNIARFLLTERFPRLGEPGPILTKILERRFPQLLVPVAPLNREDSTWMISYGFDQFLWQPGTDPTHGIGFFFNFGVSDGDPNPVEYSYLLGLGGKGVVPGRPRDAFGIGWARTQFSDDFLPFLRQRLDLGLDHEDAIEMYYNAAITPWLEVSPSIQVIDSGLEKSVNANNRLEERDTAVVFFLRTRLRF